MTNWLHHLWFTYGWPSDLGNGPEAIQQTVIYALIAVIVWPPARRAVHRFADRKLDSVKAHVAAEHARAHEADLELHRKLDHIIRHSPHIPDLPEKD